MKFLFIERLSHTNPSMGSLTLDLDCNGDTAGCTTDADGYSGGSQAWFSLARSAGSGGVLNCIEEGHSTIKKPTPIS
jgi:hypothetical protein